MAVVFGSSPVQSGLLIQTLVTGYGSYIVELGPQVAAQGV